MYDKAEEYSDVLTLVLSVMNRTIFKPESVPLSCFKTSLVYSSHLSFECQDVAIQIDMVDHTGTALSIREDHNLVLINTPKQALYFSRLRSATTVMRRRSPALLI